MGINQPCKQTISDNNIVNYISLSFFKQKSPVNCDKYHLCACMIPNWYCESPAALASPVLPLLPRTHLNPSTCALTMQSCHYPKTTKEAFLFLAQPMTWYCTGHLPLQRNKVPLKNYPETDRFLQFRTHLMKNRKNSRETGEGLNGNSVQSPHSSSPKWRTSYLDVITSASSRCKALFGLFHLWKQTKLFVIQLS